MLIGFCPSSFQVLPMCFNTPVMCPPWNARGKGEVTSERDSVRTHVFPVCLPSNFYFIYIFFLWRRTFFRSVKEQKKQLVLPLQDNALMIFAFVFLHGSLVSVHVPFICS